MVTLWGEGGSRSRRFCCSQVPPSLKDADLFAAFPSCEYAFSIHVGCCLGQACYCKIDQHRVVLILLSPPDLTLESLFSWKLSSSIHLQDDIKALCQTGRNHLWETYRGRLCGAVSFARRAWKRLMWVMQGLCGTGIPSLCLHAPHAWADRTVRACCWGELYRQPGQYTSPWCKAVVEKVQFSQGFQMYLNPLQPW